MGYYNISATIPTNQSTPLVLEGLVWILNSSIPALEANSAPFLDHMNNSYLVEVADSTQFAPNLNIWSKLCYPASVVATVDSLLGSRLLDKNVLSAPLPKLAQALQTAYPKLVLPGILVSSLGVWNAKPPVGLGSMTPAWRKAVVYFSTMNSESEQGNIRYWLTDFLRTIAFVTWNLFKKTLKAERTTILKNIYVTSLRAFSPDPGCYLNEADVIELDLPQAYR